MKEFDPALVRRTFVAEGTMAFTFERPAEFAFRAGQYVDMRLVDPAEADPAGNLRSFSIASAPHEPHLLFATRMRDTPFKRALAKLAPGERVRISAAQGELVLDDDPRPAVLIAGGIGITPILSILEDAARRRVDRRFILVYANRTPQASAFMARIDSLAQAFPALSVVHCMSEPAKAIPPWHGETGFVTEKLLTRCVADPLDAVFYAVGPPAMTAAMRDTLMNLGVDDACVRVEEFAGY